MFLFIFLIFNTFNLSIATTISDCEVYKKTARKIDCTHNYYSYAYNRCLLIKRNEESSEYISTDLKMFLKNSRSCLLHRSKMRNHKGLTCEDVWKSSQYDHSICFKENHFCELPISDMFQLNELIPLDYNYSYYFAETFSKIIYECLKI